MNKAPTGSIWEIRALAMAVAFRGGDSNAFLAELGVSEETLGDLEARVAHTISAHAWGRAPHFANDDNFGLHLAQAWLVGAFDVLEYCIRASATFGDAIEKMMRYQRVLHDASAIRFVRQGKTVRVCRRLLEAYEPAPRAVSEFVLAQMVVGGRAATGVDWAPIAVHFVHREPANSAEHRALFRAPVHFSSALDEIVFDQALLDLPVQSANPGLGAVLERHVQQLLDKLPSPDDFSGHVRRRIASSLRGEAPPVSLLAKSLGVSVRTFHRRLAEENTSYQALLDELRRDLACRHVGSGELPLGEVAFVLGFSDSSAFHRAFKRWTKMTPLQFRQHEARRPTETAKV